MEVIQKTEDPVAAMRIPEYRNLMLGRFLFIMGLRMMGTLVGWWVYELTNEPFAIGLIGLSEVIPAVSLSLYAGHIIDISEKRKLLLTGVSLYLLCAGLLLLLSTHFTTQFLSNHGITICIYIIIFFTGIFRSFTGPSFGTMVASIVPKNILQNATTWNQGIWLSASVIGHASVGFFIAGFGNSASLGIIVFLVSVGLLFMWRIKPKPPLNERGEKKTLESVKEGIRFVLKTKEVLGALSLDLFAILVIVLLTIFPLRKQQGRKLFFAVGSFGICILVFALSRSFWISFVALLLSGIVDGVSVVIRGTILQLKTPDNMRGRVMSVNSMFINSSNELGQFESGVAAKLLGVVPSVVFGGCMTIFVVATTWFKAPALRKMEY